MSRGWKLQQGKGYVLFLLVASMLLAAAQSEAAWFGSRGGRVPRADQIPLVESGRGTAAWEAREVLLQYDYNRSPNGFTIAGVIRFANLIKYNFNVIQHFHMAIVFLDPQGNVLSNQSLISASFISSGSALSFNRTVAVPAGAVAMTFTYTGRAQSAGDDNGSISDFWYYPIHPTGR